MDVKVDTALDTEIQWTDSKQEKDIHAQLYVKHKRIVKIDCFRLTFLFTQRATCQKENTVTG